MEMIMEVAWLHGRRTMRLLAVLVLMAIAISSNNIAAVHGDTVEVKNNYISTVMLSISGTTSSMVPTLVTLDVPFSPEPNALSLSWTLQAVQLNPLCRVIDVSNGTANALTPCSSPSAICATISITPTSRVSINGVSVGDLCGI
uniref:Uncharacterized protein n=1 Tax=Apopellia endiviifolia (species B) TaxID=119729 RepID=W5ZRB7_9MARC|nr:putative protein MT2 [Apopellia endiviifolia (species B)]AHI44048.1 putative protein MT2 isoform 1 [Apopellia endiviifolia (species B)]AHI44049.1 putative protein MT2 isoform 2 [Apopellia endiviifolia (species B)]AHI44050.1 putative protein MT2 isoform 3 [Apopellia endiviifolia (species B)]AHI44051.1 putative protein MT2 isoform 4 [Apopellia endiviifolia (species B)]